MVVENSDENDPFEEDIVFDQTGLLGNKSRQQYSLGFLPTFMLLIRTVFLCIAFISLGLCSSVSIGPLINLEVAVGVPTEKAFHAFTANSIGMLCGGLLGSVLFEIYNRQFLIFVSLVWMAVSVAILPFTIPYSFWWTLITIGALGTGMSFIFTGSNVLCLDLWGKQGGASLQCLHFSFAVGALIAPILIHPFLMGPSTQGTLNNFSQISTIIPLIPPQVDIHLRSLVQNESIYNFSEIQQHRDTTASMPEQILQMKLDKKLEAVISTPSTGESLSENIKEHTTLDAIKFQKSKAPQPKPSFTNGVLVPEESKWKRGSQKSSKIIVKTTSESKVSSEILRKKPVESEIFSSSTVPHTQLEVIQISSSDNKIENVTNSNEINNLNDIDINETSISQDINQSVKKDDVSKEAIENNLSRIHISTEQDHFISENNHSFSTNSLFSINMNESYPTIAMQMRNITYGGVDLSNIIFTPGSVVTQPMDNIARIVQNESSSQSKDLQMSSKTAEPRNLSNDFSIDFGHSSVDYVYPAESSDFEDDSFTNKKSMTEPEALDVRELDETTSDNEASTISVTASFPDTAMTGPFFHQSKPGTFSNSSNVDSFFLKSIADKFKNYGVTKIHVIYICVGVFVLMNALIAVIIMCHNPREPKSKQEDNTNADIAHKRRMRIFVITFSIYMFTAEALQGSIHHLLVSSNTNNDTIVGRGIDGQAIFWSLVCGMRFLCILTSGCLKVKPGKILVASTFFMVLGTIFMCIGTFDKRDFLWGGIVVAAIGLAPVLPTCFLWMAEYMKVTHSMCALMIVISSFGNSLTHTTLTYVKASTHLYSYILVGISSTSLIFLIVSFFLLYRNQSLKSNLGVPIGYHLANQEEDESIELSRPSVKNFDNMNRRLSEMGEVGQALLID